VDTHHREVDPGEGRRIGGLIRRLRQAARRLSDDQRDRLHLHLEPDQQQQQQQQLQ
jgi:Sec-independent protein translocase protein TatA